MGVQDAVKRKVLLRAPMLSHSGYGTHSRQIARWLFGRDDVDMKCVPVQWGITPWMLNSDLKDGFIGKIHKSADGEIADADVSFQVQLPNEWDPKLARVNVGVTAGVETDVCNPEWIKCIDTMDHVVVPSAFVKEMFLRTAQGSGIELDEKKIRVIPESFIDEVAGDVEPLELDLCTSFNFLAVGQMTGRDAEQDRKNIFNTIKWFCETFKGDKDVGLIIKTNNGRETKIDRKVTMDILRQVLGQVRKGPNPRVHAIHGTLSDAEMAGLYRHPSVKAFLTLTRGEGFGLPILEAAASGLPIIATNWSGHTDFLKLGKFVKLDFELQPVPPVRIDKQIFVQGARWAQVSENDVKRKLRRFRKRSETPTEWATDMQPNIQKSYSHEAICPMYDRLLQEIWST